MQRTNENYLRWQLGRWAKKYAPNVSMIDAGSAPEVQVHPDEHPIALVALASGAPPLVVTDARLMCAGETVVRYGDVSNCDWIARYEDYWNLDRESQHKLKLSAFDRLILDLTDGREVVIEGLGQAVFPLLKFFWFKLDRQRRHQRRDNPPMQRTGTAGIVSFVRKLLGRGPGR